MTAVERARTALDRIAGSERPEVWIHRRSAADVLADAADVDTGDGAGRLAGWTVAVKDNIDVAGVPTTAACPAYAYVPAASAPVVQAIVGSGGVIVGKTNMDQFATGLVGTRSPYGAVRNAVDPAFVSGGSSSGSAVAVALGLVDIALGTDTAGSGRVPAAFNGIVGMKPTHGWLSLRGIVPACPSFDCPSVFARTVADAAAAVRVMAGYDVDDVESRPAPERPPFERVRTVGVVPGVADELRPADAARYLAAVDRVRQLGLALVEIDFSLFERAGSLLYGGGFVAERYASVGAFVDEHLDACDPTVATIISAAGHTTAHQLVADRLELERLRRRATALFTTIDAVLLPTAPELPRLAEVDADRTGVNARLGRYSYSCNLLDLCAVAVPAGRGEHGLPFGVSFLGARFTDAAIIDLGADFLGEPRDPRESQPSRNATRTEHDVVVAGAHLAGQPLNHQLTERGGRLVSATTTSGAYRLFALATTPPKPGLVRAADGGRPIAVEVWRLPAAGFADLVASIPPPLAIGAVELADGTWLPGFTCTPEPLADAPEITAFGGWVAYLAATPSGPESRPIARFGATTPTQ